MASLPERVAATACQTPSPPGLAAGGPGLLPPKTGATAMSGQRRRLVHRPLRSRAAVPRWQPATVGDVRTVDSVGMHPLLLLVPASGGLGASTLAAATAGQVDGVLVDGDVEGSGADATLVLEAESGLRWPDLAGLDGSVDHRRLVPRLPGSAPPVLAAAGPCRLETHAVESAVRALRAAGPVIVDLPAPTLRRYPWVDWSDRVVVLVGLRPRQVRDAETLLAALRSAGAEPSIVTRGTRRSESVGRDVAAHLDATWLEHLEDHPGVPRDEGAGRPPRARGPLGRVAREIAAVLPAHDGEGGEGSWLRVAS